MGIINQTGHVSEDSMNSDFTQPMMDGDSLKDKHEGVLEAQTLISAHPQNYTICAPQLLHLDLSGKPLWFNGWILDNKFADKSHQQFANFESYVVEPHGWEGDDAWQLQQDNQCCLTTHARLKFSFAESEQETLNMVIQRAREVEALVLS